MSETRRHTPPDWFGPMLNRARLSRGMTQRAAGRACGNITPGYVRLLEDGLRCPSESVAEHLIAGLGLDERDAELVRSVAVPEVGRDFPLKQRVRCGAA